MRQLRQFLLVLLNHILAALNRIVNRKVFKVHEERPVFVSFNEINGRIRQLIRVVIALFRRQRLAVRR